MFQIQSKTKSQIQITSKISPKEESLSVQCVCVSNNRADVVYGLLILLLAILSESVDVNQNFTSHFKDT